MHINYPSITKIEDIPSAYFQPTLQNALSTQFYQSLWSKINITKISIDTLHLLPIITKEEVRNAGPYAQVRNGLACTEFFTRGTTATPLITVRGNREKEFIKQFFKNESELKPSKAVRVLSINNPYHGDFIAVPTNVHLHKIGVYDKGSFEHGRRVLTETHKDWGVEPYCTHLTGLERCLRAFTQNTQVLYPDGLRTHLKCVVSYGGYIMQRWRNTFEKTWGCEVIDRFSLSEIFGGATQSPICGWYHFDPFIIPEVVSSETKEIIKEGIGVLVLTALYPFQESQPMIRYLTGDLVAVTHTKSSKPGSLAIRPLGRAKYGVPLPGSNNWLLAPDRILEHVDEIPEVDRTPFFHDSEQVINPSEIGYPKYKVFYSMEGSTMKVTFQIGMSATKNENELERIKLNLISELSAGNNLLSERLSSGAVRIDIVFTPKIEPDAIFYW